MKKTSSALLLSVLALLLMGAAASTSLVYVNTSNRTLTGNIVAGNNTTISATGNGSITATALTGNISGNPTISGNLTVSGTGPNTFSGGGAADRAPIKLTDATLASLEWSTSSASANQRIWQWQAGSAVGDGVLRLRAINDALSNGSNAIVVNRSSENVTSVTIASGLTATPNGTAVLGTNTNDNAATGYVGEYVSSTVTSGSAVALSNGVTANVTSISLSAGDWDVSGMVTFGGGAVTSGYITAGIHTVSATLTAYPQTVDSPYIQTGASNQSVVLPQVRFSLSGTTTVYLLANQPFSAGSPTAYGFISARRVR